MLTAIIDYAFSQVKCDIVVLETLAANSPFLGLMNAMGLGHLGVETSDPSIGEGRYFEIREKDWTSRTS